MNDFNQNPEQIARDKIDAMLRAAGWEVQDKGKSLADLDNLPEPEDLSEDIIENLEAGLQSFREVLTSLGDRG